MERCPVCGLGVAFTWGTPCESAGENSAGRVIGWHQGPAGWACWIAGYSVGFAQAVAKIREEGGERLRLAAH
ncbi:hypothetical protein, partial [Enterococcus casseliflavus]|uniref:hypothetical protein n=1 Tax=Enterococcus casseliflavus TaxID=37734 RepID=UPI003D152E73